MIEIQTKSQISLTIDTGSGNIKTFLINSNYDNTNSATKTITTVNLGITGT